MIREERGLLRGESINPCSSLYSAGEIIVNVSLRGSARARHGMEWTGNGRTRVANVFEVDRSDRWGVNYATPHAVNYDWQNV